MGLQMEAEAGESRQSRRIWCRACTICILAFLVVIGTAAVTLFLISNFIENAKFKKGNETAFEEEDPWMEAWEAPEHIRKKIPHKFLGFDKKNQPVWFAEYGKWDLAGILADETNIEIMEMVAEQSVYRVIQSMRKGRTPENNVTAWAALIDMNDFQMLQAFDGRTQDFIFNMTGKYHHLLEKMDYGFMFNVNAFGRTVFYGMRTVLGSVLDRVHMMGYDKYEWTPLLLEKIPQDQLPQEFGGYKNFTAVAEYS